MLNFFQKSLRLRRSRLFFWVDFITKRLIMIELIWKTRQLTFIQRNRMWKQNWKIFAKSFAKTIKFAIFESCIDSKFSISHELICWRISEKKIDLYENLLIFFENAKRIDFFDDLLSNDLKQNRQFVWSFLDVAFAKKITDWFFLVVKLTITWQLFSCIFLRFSQIVISFSILSSSFMFKMTFAWMFLLTYVLISNRFNDSSIVMIYKSIFICLSTIRSFAISRTIIEWQLCNRLHRLSFDNNDSSMKLTLKSISMQTNIFSLFSSYNRVWMMTYSRFDDDFRIMITYKIACFIQLMYCFLFIVWFDLMSTS